jgi:hypothetical protein
VSFNARGLSPIGTDPVPPGGDLLPAKRPQQACRAGWVFVPESVLLLKRAGCDSGWHCIAVPVDVPRLTRIIDCGELRARPNDRARVVDAQEVLKVLRLVCSPIDFVEESLGAPDEHVVITWKWKQGDVLVIPQHRDLQEIESRNRGQRSLACR